MNAKSALKIATNYRMHGSCGGQWPFEININSRRPVMRAVLRLDGIQH
ncbi:MAG: hypothetical protein J0M26_00755 [Planctomycetes bacterium]|nr:hypothetical protein [Planctomycetota bacterium]